MKCKALKDGLVNRTDYVRPGDVFEAKKCPSWAVPVVPAKKAETKTAEQQKDGE